MLTNNFVITCAVGLHARPASVLVSIAEAFKSDIIIRFKEKEVPAKSLIGVMTLGAETGESIEISVTGEDQEKAMERMVLFFEKELQEL